MPSIIFLIIYKNIFKNTIQSLLIFITLKFILFIIVSFIRFRNLLLMLEKNVKYSHTEIICQNIHNFFYTMILIYILI